MLLGVSSYKALSEGCILLLLFPPPLPFSFSLLLYPSPSPSSSSLLLCPSPSSPPLFLPPPPPSSSPLLSLQLSVRSKNTKEKLGSLFKGFSKSIDESMLKGHKDVDQWFENEKKFLTEYHVKYVAVPLPSSLHTHTHKHILVT